MGQHGAVPCLGENTMVDLLEQRLTGERLALVHAHLEGCDLCRELVAASAGALQTTLHDIEDEPTNIAPVPMIVHSELGPGSRIDHYRIERLLGQGGMGEVYQAHDTNLERRVALKVIKPELLQNEKSYQMFLTEARATARLAHPNIVTIHAVGAYQGQPYVALELLVGHTLRDRLLLGELEGEQRVKIALAIADALAAAHAASVFHRDLKPSNVMLCADGRTRVLDFGLAMIADADVIAAVREGRFAPTLDGTIALAGTPAYMAPEQWTAGPVTGAADMWGLGVLMFEMCTRKRPYDHLRGSGPPTAHDLVRLAEAIRSTEEAPIAGALEAASVPPELRAIIGRCLAKEPSRRPTPHEVVKALQPLELQHTVSAMSLSGGALAAAPPRPPSTRWRWLGAAAAMVGLGVVGWQTLERSSGPETPRRFPAAVLAPSVDIGASPPQTSAVPEAPPSAAVAPAPSSPRGPAPRATTSALPSLPEPQPSATTTVPPSWDPMSYR